eukprot:scaffold117376_cov21-Tisochrysis_lutea.AAC.1
MILALHGCLHRSLRFSTHVRTGVCFPLHRCLNKCVFLYTGALTGVRCSAQVFVRVSGQVPALFCTGACTGACTGVCLALHRCLPCSAQVFATAVGTILLLMCTDSPQRLSLSAHLGQA